MSKQLGKDIIDSLTNNSQDWVIKDNKIIDHRKFEIDIDIATFHYVWGRFNGKYQSFHVGFFNKRKIRSLAKKLLKQYNEKPTKISDFQEYES